LTTLPAVQVRGSGDAERAHHVVADRHGCSLDDHWSQPDRDLDLVAAQRASKCADAEPDTVPGEWAETF
jgi:hypothetical protein